MSIVPALLCAIEWWTVNPVGPEMNLPDAAPARGEKGAELRLVATPGDMASLSFVLRSDADLKGVSLAATGDLAAAMDPYVVKCWYQQGSAWYGFVADSKDASVQRVGRRALAYIAYWDPFRADPRAFRAECIRFALRLKELGV